MTISKTLQKTETQALRRTLCNVETKSLVNTPAENLPEAKAKTNQETLDDVKPTQ